METKEQKFAQGIAYKDEGNQHFKDGEWQKAVGSYHHAALYLKGLVSEGTSIGDLIGGATGSPSDGNWLPESKRQLSVVRNNMAACFLKLEKFPRAIQCADECLQLDPSNVKAAYRKLQALRQSKDLRYKAFLDEMLAKHPHEDMLKTELQEWNAENKKKVAEADKKMSGFLNKKKPAAAGAAGTGTAEGSKSAVSTSAAP
ncbi:hypothetical protein CF327_g2920 [Tilletia walkeri]|uniref:Uncharacterized protein n=1 Tax=Tilletia walkeri TaxID=117179 RepID=A0A8X7NDI7_9BASI|nr:hypothetical protein CF327_g2920 [Tilletia walkeri]KAE8271264.1 hypothetical protein A4X09_0g1096 [Tilletia walkeri]